MIIGEGVCVGDDLRSKVEGIFNFWLLQRKIPIFCGDGCS